MPAAEADTLVGCDTAGLITAITNANRSGGGTQDLATGCTYTLTSGPYNDGFGPDGLPVITSAITVHANGATVTRDSIAPDFRLIELAGTGSLTAEGIALTNGKSSYGGGAIFSKGAVTLTDGIVSANSTDGSSDGGGIYAFGGTVSLTKSTFSANSAGVGGGIGIAGGGLATITNSAFAGNSAAVAGGGIYNSGTVATSNSTFSGNSASIGGGVWTNEPATFTNSTIAADSASKVEASTRTALVARRR